MKVIHIVVAATALLLLLTWLSMQGANDCARTSEGALHATTEFLTAENALHRDVLRARAGMLRNYDPLIQDLDVMWRSVGRLRAAAAALDPGSQNEIEQLQHIVEQEEYWTEQLKTRNALLQNSLAYFGQFRTQLAEDDRESALAQQVSALAAAMLRLTLDTSPASTADVDQRLTAVSVNGLTPRRAAAVQALLAHARLLRNLLPESDGVLKSLFALPAKQQIEKIRAVFAAEIKASEDRALFFRRALYAASLLLLGLLVHLGLRLQARADLLRLHANIEHVTAGSSTYLINAQYDRIGSSIRKALELLAGSIGADRAYFIITGPQPQMICWSRDGVPFPPDWPEPVVELVQQLSPHPDRVIHIPNTSGRCHGKRLHALISAGVIGWLCIPSAGRKFGDGILAFDALRPGVLTRRNDLRLLRMAFDAIADALDRDVLERERERLEANLHHARRLETIGTLASGVAHNFNNIVGAIQGYAEMASAEVEAGSRPASHLGEIRRAAERARDLVDQILTFGRKGNTKRDLVCIRTMVTETQSLLEASLPQHAGLVIRHTTDVAIVSGDLVQLQQVLLNVCNNAAQAMDESGCIEIEIDTQIIDDTRQVGSDALSPGRYIVLTVADAGRGMDAETLARVFEPFFTTRRVGTGLGLSTVQEIVRAHEGAVAVQSEQGAGTQVEIWLPSAPASASMSSREALSAIRRGNGQMVLILESDRERLLRHEEIVAAFGYEPVGFTRAGEAISVLSRSLSRVDAAVICHRKSATEALESAAALHRTAPDVPIILATASASELGAHALAAAGVSEIVRQPLASSELADVLARCMRTTSPLLQIAATSRPI